MTEVKETIKYTPYRGKCEPVTEVRKAEITLYPNHIEFIHSYDFDLYLPESDEIGYMKHASIYPKNLVSVTLTEAWHSRDTTKTASPVVKLFCDSEEEWVYVETEKEAYDIYSRIKKWMLNE